MNRRKPQLRVAVIPVEEGEELAQAVLRKAAAAAVSALSQCAALEGSLSAFAAGYLAGFARQLALKHGGGRAPQEGLRVRSKLCCVRYTQCAEHLSTCCLDLCSKASVKPFV